MWECFVLHTQQQHSCGFCSVENFSSLNRMSQELMYKTRAHTYADGLDQRSADIIVNLICWRIIPVTPHGTMKYWTYMQHFFKMALAEFIMRLARQHLNIYSRARRQTTQMLLQVLKFPHKSVHIRDDGVHIREVSIYKGFAVYI